MPEGFFSASTLISRAKRDALVPRCGACGLYKTCNSPKMPVQGKGERGILLIGEAPGETEDRENEQFVGPTGQVLREELGKLCIEMDVDCWKTNALICRPPKNAKPTTDQLQHCLPNLKRTIADLKPVIIIPLGAAATYATLLPAYSAVEHAVGPWVGAQIPCQAYNAWVCPAWHPSYIARERKAAKGKPCPASIWWVRHLGGAVAYTSRPWVVVPDYASGVELVYDAEDAAKRIQWVCKQGGPTAFDFETNALRPETTGARIYSCAICWRGRRTFAYPWHGAAITATKEYLQNDIPKIGTNIKYEDRWARRLLGVSVRGWVFDTMLAAHLIDNRPGITGLKHQAFRLLGYGNYNTTVESCLTETNKQGLNRVDQIALDDLLTYNGLDALLSYKVAAHQAPQLEVDLCHL